MLQGWLDRYKAPIIILLILVIAAGVVVLLDRHPWRSQPIEIVLSTPTPALSPEVKVYMGGAVTSPGWYSLVEGDSLGQVIIAAGGTSSDADPSRVKLYVYKLGEGFEPQRISINRAEAWLLEALPGIGPALAQRIVDYRSANGAFERVEDLKRVQGIGGQTYESLKGLITVE